MQSRQEGKSHVMNRDKSQKQLSDVFKDTGPTKKDQMVYPMKIWAPPEIKSETKGYHGKVDYCKVNAQVGEADQKLLSQISSGTLRWCGNYLLLLLGSVHWLLQSLDTLLEGVSHLEINRLHITNR